MVFDRFNQASSLPVFALIRISGAWTPQPLVSVELRAITWRGGSERFFADEFAETLFELAARHNHFPSVAFFPCSLAQYFANSFGLVFHVMPLLKMQLPSWS